ncbi:DUF3999 family protein [Sphingomonas sp. Leaf198]|uniref:DUF3999 family protein n=1 Tax=Sphingomonas sp. Leaf198 TaxID=1736299 RepID=UPI0006FE4391|nr:DUF3999 family protein [Sphingomonas sp. Leaf198]KQS51633.1 hypothetical protein ASG20_06525 [Sphingomonas sp. Leaf198]
MTTIGKLAGLALAACALAGAAPTGSSDDAASYAVRVPITVAAGSPVQRLAIPPQILAVAQTADLSDLRVFDATGRAMPIARLAPAAPATRRTLLPVLPIMGAADALDVTGVSLRLDGDGRARVAEVTGTVRDAPTIATVLGVLLDTRAIVGEARSLAVGIDMPAAQPVTLTVEASDDLKTWRSIGEKVVYRTANARQAAVVVPLGEAVLHRDYLRIVWRGTSRLLSPVTIHRALLITRDKTTGGGPSVEGSAPPLTDAHAIEFGIPFAAAISAIRIVPTGRDVIVPIRLFSRDDREQPWLALGESTAARSVEGMTATQDDIGLDGGAHRTVRIEAAQRSAGFTSAPMVTFHFAPREIAFLAIGTPPFVVAAGQAGVADAYLPLASVLTQAPNGQFAIAKTALTRVTVRLAPIGDTSAMRKGLLWTILLIATGVLGMMAWFLWRNMASR